MRFSKMIPKDKVSLINEEQSKRLTTICFKRKFVHTSLADSDCSSLKSKRDAETTKSPLETIDVHMSTEKVKTLLNLNIVKDHKFSMNSDDICTISTIDSNKEIEPNIFKRKNKRINDEISDENIYKLNQEKQQIINKTKFDSENIKKHYANIKKDKIENENFKFKKKLDLISEEHSILEKHYKDEIIYLKNRVNLDENILITQHHKIIENSKFSFEMRKKIMNEKIKYFTTLLKENQELLNVYNTKSYRTVLSELDLSNFNFNEQSVIDKSEYATIKDQNSLIIRGFRQSENYDNLCSIILKENNVIGNINTIRPKFFSKEKD